MSTEKQVGIIRATGQAVKSMLDKTTVANVVAATVVVVGLAVTAYYQKWEIFAVVVTAGVTYLFPKTQN